MSSHVRDLIQWILNSPDVVAMVHEQALQPLTGRTVYPATYAGNGKDDKPRYCIAHLRDGSNVCTIDSIPSQANRLEAEWVSNPRYAGLFPNVSIEATQHDGSTSVRPLMLLGHRAADGAVLASELNEEVTAAMLAMSSRTPNPVPLARLSPTSLLMGLWDSRPNRTGLKLPRAFSAEIEATNVSERIKHSLYNAAWHASHLHSSLVEAIGTVKPSVVGLESAPDGDAGAGVEVHGEIVRRATLSMIPLRSNLGWLTPEDKDAAHQITAEYTATLGLLALSMPTSPYLRVGCTLLPAGSATMTLVRRDGSREVVSIEHDAVLEALGALASQMGFVDRVAKLTPKSVKGYVDAVTKEKKEGAGKRKKKGGQDDAT
ncbi:type I-G CRISPR-associated RAMP protein Csb1/Cas7g [Parachitinimonas caeni]|uniref:Type I-U CRISPR-associated RAMP protein Csb1/Cas7u n=1 Tax=Parachitinimonas caeni TaxID=3031301 RepID=A0ABT7E2G7_9NEIS|nr:type I-U CRISPR-associated RAMP protein Csb1/Cas7u [Parachitinimonas caeni]MDK2126493.1 type I-U CRISPR-associated RAMP protein Csb1/Cas7u [Parachitinimonas caeni]